MEKEVKVNIESILRLADDPWGRNHSKLLDASAVKMLSTGLT